MLQMRWKWIWDNLENTWYKVPLHSFNYVISFDANVNHVISIDLFAICKMKLSFYKLICWLLIRIPHESFFRLSTIWLQANILNDIEEEMCRDSFHNAINGIKWEKTELFVKPFSLIRCHFLCYQKRMQKCKWWTTKNFSEPILNSIAYCVTFLLLLISAH